jgi:hypothetical protein
VRRLVAVLSASSGLVFASGGCDSLIGVRTIFFDADGSALGSDGGTGDAPGPDGEAGRPDAPSDAPACAADLTTDAKNCGACGHDCLGGACAAGACQPAKVVFGVGKPWAVAVDNSYVYWSDTGQNSGKGTVWRLDKNATLGAPDKLGETTAVYVYALAVDATGVYFGAGENQTGEILRVPGLGVAAEQVVTTNGGPKNLSLTADALYWTESGASFSGTVRTAPKMPNATATTLVNDPSEPQAAVVSGMQLFWGNEHIISRCTLPTCSDGMTIAQMNVESIAIDGDSLTYSNGGTLFQFPKTGSGPGAAIATQQAEAIVVLRDDKDLYWANLGTSDQSFQNGDIRRCPIASGTPKCGTDTAGEIVAKAQFPRGMAMDAHAVYWSSETDGAVYRLAR